MRSSSEWKRDDDQPAARLQHALGGGERRRPVRRSSSLTKMRSAWNVRVAGWMRSGRACTTRADDLGQRRRGGDRRLGARRRRWRAATARRMRSSPSVADDDRRDRARRRAPRRRRRSGPRRPCACRAGRRTGTRSRARPRRAASRRRRCRARRRRPTRWPNLCATASRSEKRSSTSVSRPPACRTRPAPCAIARLVAVDADHRGAGGGENRAGVAAGAERAVDIDAAVADFEMLEHRRATARERDGPVRQRVPRRPPSFPCSERLPPRSRNAAVRHRARRSTPNARRPSRDLRSGIPIRKPRLRRGESRVRPLAATRMPDRLPLVASIAYASDLRSVLRRHGRHGRPELRTERRRGRTPNRDPINGV